MIVQYFLVNSTCLEGSLPWSGRTTFSPRQINRKIFSAMLKTVLHFLTASWSQDTDRLGANVLIEATNCRTNGQQI